MKAGKENGLASADVLSSSMISAQKHTLEISIDVTDIDFMGHVNNAIYLKWVQAATIDHWRRIAPPDSVDRYLWIALKHEITYRLPAFIDDRLTANVSLQKVQRESAFYETLVQRGSDVVVEVRSRWCCVDAQTRQPARVPHDVVQCFFPQSA